MFNKNTKEPTSLDHAIEGLLTDMSSVEVASEEYAGMVKHLTELYKLRVIDTPQRINPDTILIVSGNLLGILAILQYEHTHVIASKALGFVMKLR